ncbi:MAG: type VI secretion system protein TssL [Methylomonas sp.]|nr:MAG: type VI secretion system protein TssL [Methylomonas sp.]
MADCPKCPPVGAPMWLTTFADLMSLLMCFFILLLSMASMDVVKFKAAADSLQHAFGVQRQIEVVQIPMGNSVIEQHFSPGQVQPTPLDEIRQSTEDEKENAKEQFIQDKLSEIKVEAEKIKQQLNTEIEQGLVTVETNGFRIVIRISETGSFDSASAILQPGFEPVMDKITQTVTESQGKVVVAGHTDDMPIKTLTYRSNWELSASRAVTVAQYMLEKKQIDPNRFLIEGHADTHPLAPNESPENRAKNRRVEIIIARDEALLQDKLGYSKSIQTDQLTR